MRRALVAAAACSLLCVTARADLPVTDIGALIKLGNQVQLMEQQLTQAEATVHSLTNIPQNLAGMVTELLQSAVQNPLGEIEQNLQMLMSGQGTGTCNGSQDYLTRNDYAMAQGTDFTGQWINQSANRNAGLQACTQQMITATQTRLQQMPQLLAELQGATDLTQVETIKGRIELEIATINAQQQQAALMAQTAAMQRAMASDQVLQKMRADAQEVIRSTDPNATHGAVPNVMPTPQPFSALNGGGG